MENCSLTIDLDDKAAGSLDQIRYALTFLSEDVISYDIHEGDQKIYIEFRQGTNAEEMRERVDRLVRRYSNPEFGLKSVVYLDQRRELPAIDAWEGKVSRKWATPVGEGHVILRGP